MRESKFQKRIKKWWYWNWPLIILYTVTFILLVGAAIIIPSFLNKIGVLK